ncbi:hypothetical protein MA16_Dca017458 [Dendrobium catenatum]|uniref:Uncharacterized protein n=1 Tax=Dendrobium catenatum TaxID=906689 RepID=A0A2I0WAS0_9ASPA|nr:hypothetical protein MA16_Dca017458 [Dendrobium catenatum]
MFEDQCCKNLASDKNILQESKMRKAEDSKDNYGPWVLVNNKRRIFKSVVKKTGDREAWEKKKQQVKTWNIKAKKTNLEEIKENSQDKLSIPVNSQELQCVEEGEIIEEPVEACEEDRAVKEDKNDLGMEERSLEISEGDTVNRIVMEAKKSINPFEILGRIEEEGNTILVTKMEPQSLINSEVLRMNFQDNQGELNQMSTKTSSGKIKLAKEMKLLGPIKGKTRTRRGEGGGVKAGALIPKIV